MSDLDPTCRGLWLRCRICWKASRMEDAPDEKFMDRGNTWLPGIGLRHACTRRRPQLVLVWLRLCWPWHWHLQDTMVCSPEGHLNPSAVVQCTLLWLSSHR